MEANCMYNSGNNYFIKSPLNYTGNKYRILNQIIPKFPNKVNTMIDLFCGGATVGLNCMADKIIFVDSNIHVINLLKFLSTVSFEEIMITFEKIIKKYNLSYSYKFGYKKYRECCANLKDNNGLKEYNINGFNRLKEDYNALKDKNTKKANSYLYILMVYGFNNDIRFNSEGLFNLPVGKTDLNKMNVEKIKSFIDRIKHIDCEFRCVDFCEPKFYSLLKDVDFVYMDPPYLLGDAVYNTMWNVEREHKLLDLIDYLMNKKINFALSNVSEKGDRKNEPLYYWCHKNEKLVNVFDINYNYRSANYHKKNRNAVEREILITNKEYIDANK